MAMKRSLLILLIFIAGCAAWTRVGGLYTSKPHNFSVELPNGWMRFNTRERLYTTRDGALLQNIIVERLNIEKPLKHTKKKFGKSMLPQEAAQVVLDNISSDQTVLNFQVIENIPARISGFPGFRVVFTYKNKDGLRLKSILYGFISDEWFYGIRYTAAHRYYFDKDLETFMKVFASFKLIKTV
jgi:hypothetical protein